MNRKALLVLFAVLVLFTGTLFASESRMNALGNPFGYVRDNTDIFSYPGVIHQYQRRVDAELGFSSMDWKLGANLPFMNSVLGMYLNGDTGITLTSTELGNVNGFFTGDLDISKKVQFYYGFMDKFGVGFGMAIDSKIEPTAVNKKYYEMGASYFEISGGMSEDKMDLGAAISLWGASTSNDLDNNSDEAGYAGIELNAQGRYYIMQNEMFDLVGIGSLAVQSTSSEEKVSSAKKTVDTSSFGLDLGIGIDYKFDSNNHVIFGVKPFRLVSTGVEDKDSSGTDKSNQSWLFIPTYTIGLESQIKPWLVGRIGATQDYVFYGSKVESSGSETEDGNYDSNFNMDMGLGFKFGKFCIDTVLSKTLLHDGPNFIGGRTNGLASKVSINYEY